jgi:hypothetical protein
MSRVSTASSPTGGGLAGAATWAGLAKIPFVLLLLLVTATPACRVYSIGLAIDGSAGDSAGLDASDSGDERETWAIDAANAYRDGEPADLAPMSRDPLIVGCSDGTREGFRDIRNWPSIAGCAGGWTSSGLLSQFARKPECLRVDGNDSNNPEGVGCSAADLCAPTWHVCLDGPDVASHSPTGGCESIVSPGYEALFVVMTGASPQGVCSPDPSAANDLHGCGSIGQPESAGCPPLDRRMNFADCIPTVVWQCGTVDDSLREADVVTKSGSSLGGVLCCKD